jgi:hypothetical protein
MREELRQEIQRRISAEFERARQASTETVVDEERMKEQRDRFVEFLFKSAEKQLGK